MSENSEPAAKTGNKQIAQAYDYPNDTNGEVNTGAALLIRILVERRQKWQGRGQYKEPAPPDTTDLPPLPECWTWATLESLTLNIADVDHRMPKAILSGIPYVSTRDFGGENEIDFERAKRISQSDYDLLARKVKPELGDILLSRYGTVGEVRRVKEVSAFQASYSIAILKTHRDAALNSFLVYVLRSDIIQRQIRRDVRASAQPDLGLAFIRKFVVPLPPSAEQRRIVEEIEKQFTRLEAGVAALQRVQANLKRYRATVLKAACEGRLVPTEAERLKAEGGTLRDFESGERLLKRILTERRQNWQGRGPYKEPAALDTMKLFQLPEGWTWTTLDALAEIKGGITKDQNRKHAAPARSVPYLRVANVQRGYIDLTEVKEIFATEDEIRELALKPGDILFNEGGDRDKLGRGWVWNSELPECIHQNHVFRARPYVAELNSKLVSWYANTFGQKFFFDEGKHTTNLASISMSKLKGLPVPIPPPTEQTRIVAEVERRLSVVEELESVVSANLQRATGLRQSILQKAFTGQLI
ncbi:MAG: type restriction enzyme subunit [Blastocatellia bacterium]|nr:type restriction enzyme subunit [Blastocatellia bacterium]